MFSQDKDLFSIAESLESDQDSIQYQKFADYHQGDKADGTIIQYMRYLSKLDFNPTADDPEPSKTEIDSFDLSKVKYWGKKQANRKDVDKDRFTYITYVAVKNYLEALGEIERLNELPASRQIPKPQSKSAETYYSENQIQKVIDQIPQQDQQLRLTVVHMFYAGMRTYEILNMKPTWYEFPEEDDEPIEIEIPEKYAKGKKNSKEPEYCYLPSKYESEVKKYILGQYPDVEEYNSLITETDSLDTLFSFIEDSDKDFKALARERYHLNKALQEAAENSGINKAQKISAHLLRKSFVHHIYEGEDGLNLSRTSKLARHENTNLTDKHYLNVEKEENKQDYQKVMT